ncbi:MAG TPA: hypothetical protein VGE47_00615 [Burkholderiaceae bacterium]
MRPAIQATVSALALTFTLAATAADALRVVRDPVTGELRAPNAAEAAAMEKAEAQLRLGSKATPKAPVEIQYPDGSVERKLGEDTMLFSVVSSDAKGNLNFACLPAEQARTFVAARPAAASSAKAEVSK